jgi:hypothetical protein
VEELYGRLKGSCPEWLLKLHGTANYDTLQRDAAVKTLLLGRQAAYLRHVDEAVSGSPMLYSRSLCWLVYLLSGGGRWGRGIVVRRLLAAAGR